MLLRRVIKHVREQNWTAVGIDFVIVVIGVFVGIQVANWNEERQQAARQAGYLERLRVDFIGSRERITEHLAVFRDGVDGGEFILSIVRSGDDAPPAIDDLDARMARAFDALAAGRIPPPLPATYVEMRSEGQLSRIANPALRDRLADYDRLVGVLQEASRSMENNLVLQVPILQRHFDTRPVSDDSKLSGIRNELLSHDIAAMRRDREFAVAVKTLQRAALNSLSQRKRQLALIEEILRLIDAEAGR